MIEEQDYRTRRCPRLGGRVDFKYCRMGSGTDPVCWKIFDCWWETFDVRQFLAENLTADQFQRLTEARPPSKINSLLDLIAQARQRNAQS